MISQTQKDAIMDVVRYHKIPFKQAYLTVITPFNKNHVEDERALKTLRASFFEKYNTLVKVLCSLNELLLIYLCYYFALALLTKISYSLGMVAAFYIVLCVLYSIFKESKIDSNESY